MRSREIKLKYIDTFTDRHGHRRFYFRRGNGPRLRLPDIEAGAAPGPEFMLKYNGYLAGQTMATIPMPRERRGTIYFAGYGDYLKIGFTSGSVATRIRDLATGSPLPITIYATLPGSTMADERVLHKRFKRLRLQNEWFRMTDSLLAWVISVQDENKTTTFSPNHDTKNSPNRSDDQAVSIA